MSCILFDDVQIACVFDKCKVNISLRKGRRIDYLWKEIINSGGKRFYQYQQNELSPLSSQRIEDTKPPSHVTEIHVLAWAHQQTMWQG